MKDFGNPHKFSFINFAKKIIDDINFTFPLFSNQKWKFSLNKYIYSVIFYESIAIFKIGRDRCKTNEFIFTASPNFVKTILNIYNTPTSSNGILLQNHIYDYLNNKSQESDSALIPKNQYKDF